MWSFFTCLWSWKWTCQYYSLDLCISTFLQFITCEHQQSSTEDNANVSRNAKPLEKCGSNLSLSLDDIIYINKRSPTNVSRSLHAHTHYQTNAANTQHHYSSQLHWYTTGITAAMSLPLTALLCRLACRFASRGPGSGRAESFKRMHGVGATRGSERVAWSGEVDDLEQLMLGPACDSSSCGVAGTPPGTPGCTARTKSAFTVMRPWVFFAFSQETNNWIGDSTEVIFHPHDMHSDAPS